ncbi:Eco57I restriction-modification methylase domain-containing protein [Streptococcus sp. HMSC074F05]|uniref:type IIG restriction enzyme/methyltransferase n=1 Tax=Streptococcus sp. HMSC074F05 TaxID=1715164 RepID=UPI0008A1ACA6|nr:TaqI-like C-terminal specificity domain-containing protein [Streptococcus sp. HMSC074F05]OFN92921.1 type II restriction endonuclease [Streptococcus sp. HMSC074F05]
MAINELSLKGSMNRSVQAIMPLDEDKEAFGKKLVTYLTHLYDNQRESEEYQKNLLKSFLEELLPHNFINTSNRIDLAIYNGKDSNSTLGVIFEHKSLTNKSEMMSKEKINSKAFQEIVAYYLRERLFEHNLEIKKCIVTNGLSWFVIEAKEIEKHFIKNKKLVDLVTKFKNNQLSNHTTDFLYKEVISPAIDLAIDKGIEIAHFNIKDALIKNSKSFEIKKNNLTQLYRFFTAENLLNKEIFTDSNKLNKNFYDELLYLMGLEESKVGTSKIISRLKPSKRQQYSFVENIIDKLEVKDVPKDRQEDIAIQLTVIWMNRILFLKLLESQLVLFNKDESYRFLTYDKLPSFEEIYTLFFAVLAKKITDRNERVQKKFGYIPYLNSSLFEENELEVSRDGIGIDRLPEGDIEIFSKTSLKGSNNKRKSGKINFIQYLFEFLDSYDFSTSISHHEKSKNDLINASVLGLIFEKINGYRDGSFYTPGNITMYMSRRAVRMAVVDKVNETMSWNCESIEDMKLKVRSMEIAKKISDTIDQIKICDPAVGSGHFLVSVLNEIIALKSDLNVLFDSEGNYIGNIIQCYVINDELIIQDMSGNNFVYQVGNDLAERIQKSIFTQKRQILENTLFGVDINPSSVNICRLRLWIELLKSSYYYIDEEINQPVLTTLPNIDINIKVGDSLLHKFDFNYEFDLRRNDFKEYLDLVREYKDTNNKATKASIWDKIERLKYSFDDLASSPELKKLHKLISEKNKAGAISLFEEENNNNKEYLLLSKQLEKAKKEFEERLKNPLYAGGMEWRMEFPEILGENGEFIGFDLVIGNPPYIFARNQSFTEEMKAYYLRTYQVSEYQANTYTIFMELAYQLLRKGGSFSYIIPNNFLTIQNNSKIRKFITEQTSDVVLINSLDKIFTDASVDNCIIFFKKNSPNWIEVAELHHGDFNTVGRVEPEFFGEIPIFSISMVKYRQAIDIYWKVNEYPVLDRQEIATVKAGIMAYETGKGKPRMTTQDKLDRIYHSYNKEDESYRRYIDGENVSRYKLTWNGEFIKYGENLAAMRDPKLFDRPRILVRQIPSKNVYSIEAVYTDSDVINDRNSMIITEINVNPLYLLGILNSRLISLWFFMRYDKFQRRLFPQFKVNELGEFPIPNSTKEQQDSIAILVEQLMDEMKKETPDSELVSKLNLDIDNLVMDLFDLTEEEKKIVSEFTL